MHARKGELTRDEWYRMKMVKYCGNARKTLAEYVEDDRIKHKCTSQMRMAELQE